MVYLSGAVRLREADNPIRSFLWDGHLDRAFSWNGNILWRNNLLGIPVFSGLIVREKRIPCDLQRAILFLFREIISREREIILSPSERHPKPSEYRIR